ncbi:MAG: DUF1592 domain-containing protein [Candidatus Solibacter usitatus]|nr:DUF1592 domain-containing protein [Candidatus Solibacter usitatus]
MLLWTPVWSQTFDTTVKPVLRQNCFACHNQQLASGNLNVQPLFDSSSLSKGREVWEKVVSKLRGGEMPPQGAPALTDANREALVNFVEKEFDRADRAVKPDPGRVTARRLNRVEYAATVRDLLGVDFSATSEFPADDASYGFDNISEVLTVSPTLMQKYLSAGEQIAARAIGADPLPKPGLFNKRGKVKRLGEGIEVNDEVLYDAEYDIRVLITGHRGSEGKPVTLQISVDGKPLKTVPVESAITLVNKQGGATQRVYESHRMFLPQGRHTYKAEFLNDEIGRKLQGQARFNPSQNIYPETFEIAGPFPSTELPPVRKKILTCDPASGVACVTRILSPLTRRAYRRPATFSEVNKLVAVHQRALKAGYTPGQSLQFAIAAMLVSPQFLFRIERSPLPGTYARISDLELATRMSYFLWSSMPDDELLTAAEKGMLRQPTVFDAQLRRMLLSPKAIALAENFASQWLETRSLDAVKPDPAKFPAYTTDLREAMRSETQLFFDHMLRENRPISDFIDARYTFLNEPLAKHYGIDSVKGPEFRRVDLATDQRGGILTHASVLTVSSYPSRTSVVLRGKYLLENIFGAPPPAAPPEVPALDEAEVGTAKSLRQQMEQHRTNPVCASCHARMDVLGFGLENYDAIGRWRTMDGKFPVDSSGTFPNGKSFATPAEMKKLLTANLPEFASCLTEKMLTYALGRGVERFDRAAVRDIVRQMAAKEYRLQPMIAGIVRSLPFQARRGEAGPVPPTKIDNNRVNKETARK